MYQIRRIERKSVSEEVFEQIMDNIVKRQWPCGAKLPSEQDLAAMFGVSRVSVRAAIQKLIALGIIESRNGEGTFVRQFNAGTCLNALIPMLVLEPRDILELLEFRKGVERLSCELAARRATPGDIEALGEVIGEMRKSCQNNDIAQYTIEDFRFHFLIAKISGNSVIESVMTILKDHIVSHFSEMNRELGISLNFRRHEGIFEAIARHDEAAAGLLIQESLDCSIESIRKLEKKKTENNSTQRG